MNRLTPVSVAAGNGATAPGRLGLLSGGVAAPPGMGGGTRLPGVNWGSGVGPEGTAFDGRRTSKAVWSFEVAASLASGTEGAYSLNTAFNQGRWIAELDAVVYWVYAAGGTSTADLYGDVILEPAGVAGDPTAGPGRVEFRQQGYTPALVVAPPGTDDGYMVVYIGPEVDRAVPLLYSWMPTEALATVTMHTPEGEVDGVATKRCAYPVGVVSEDGGQAFVVYTLSMVNYTGAISDYDTTRRVRMLRYSTADGAVDDFEVDTDTRDAAFSHSHFPSVAVTPYRDGTDISAVLVVWRSFYTAFPESDESAIRGRLYVYGWDGTLYQDDGPFDIASAAEGGVYASDPSVIGLGNGDFLVAFTARPTSGGRGAVYTRTYSVHLGADLGDFAPVEPDGTDGAEATFPHKFPSLATNAAKDRVLMAYEVGTSGPDNSHGTRVARMRTTYPTVWTTMALTDGNGDGECDPTEDASDLADLVGDLGLQGEKYYEEKVDAQQTINPCVLIRSSDEDFVGFVLRDNMDIADPAPAGTNTMSLELYAATVPW